MEHTHYYPPANTRNQNLIDVFIDHLYSRLSSTQWHATRQHYGQPTYRNEIQYIHNLFLLGQHAKPLTSGKGAYHDLPTFFENILLTYLVCNAFGDSPMRDGDILWFKFSWDNRHLLRKNEAFTITLLNTPSSQSVLHMRDFCIVQGKENKEILKPVLEEVGLNSFLRDFTARSCIYKNKEFTLDFIISADWIALITELCASRPNTKDLDSIVCWGCGANKHYLRGGYLQDPFEFYEPTLTLLSFPNALLSNVPLLKRRYDCMHGITNVLSNIITVVIKSHLSSKDLVTLNALLDICLDHRIHPTGFHAKSALTCREMKAFFYHNLHELLPQLFHNPAMNKFSPYPQPNSLPTLLSFSAALALCLDACRYYHDLIYKQFPTQNEIDHLMPARTNILSFYAGNQWRLPPTTHYMTNEAIYFINLDKSAYPTLQEGVEMHNFADMVASTHTLQSSEHVTSHESNWVSLLNRDLLVLETQKYNLAPSSHMLLPYSTHPLFTHNKPLQPLKGKKIDVHIICNHIFLHVLY